MLSSLSLGAYSRRRLNTDALLTRTAKATMANAMMFATLTIIFFLSFHFCGVLPPTVSNVILSLLIRNVSPDTPDTYVILLPKPDRCPSVLRCKGMDFPLNKRNIYAKKHKNRGFH